MTPSCTRPCRAPLNGLAAGPSMGKITRRNRRLGARGCRRTVEDRLGDLTLFRRGRPELVLSPLTNLPSRLRRTGSALQSTIVGPSPDQRRNKPIFVARSRAFIRKPTRPRIARTVALAARIPPRIGYGMAGRKGNGHIPSIRRKTGQQFRTKSFVSPCMRISIIRILRRSRGEAERESYNVRFVRLDRHGRKGRGAAARLRRTPRHGDRSRHAEPWSRHRSVADWIWRGRSSGEYDLWGHVHGKKSAWSDAGIGDAYRTFLWDNLIGGEYPMLDIAVAAFASDPNLGSFSPRIRIWSVGTAIARMPNCLPSGWDFRASCPSSSIFRSERCSGFARPLCAGCLHWG